MNAATNAHHVEAIRRAVLDGEGAAAANASAMLDRIAARDAEVHAFLAVNADAVREAEAVDAASDPTPLSLAGVPIAIKDNICTLGMPTTCGSRMLEGYVSPFEATVVRRLREAGAIIAGKTNLDEFAMGSSTEHSAYGATRNPLDLSRVPGGSSGGSAAAVAAGMVAAALGSETGGSIRQPASFCGVVGLNPSWGRVSRYGLIAFASSLDQIGVLAGSVADAAAVLEAIAGHDPLDATSSALPVPDLRSPQAVGVQGMVVGVPREYFPPDLDPAVAALCRASLEALKAAGAEIREVSLPHALQAIPAYYGIAPAEASSNLARFDGIRFGRAEPGASVEEVNRATRTRWFGPEVKRRIILGTHSLTTDNGRYYARALEVRKRIVADFRAVFDAGVDVLFTPTTPGPAFRFGERTDAYAMYLSDVFTVSANLAGLPAVSIPIGLVQGLPVGGQLIADRWDEAGLIRAAAGLERLLAGDA